MASYRYGGGDASPGTGDGAAAYQQAYALAETVFYQLSQLTDIGCESVQVSAENNRGFG